MEQKTTLHASSLSPIWEHLEAFIRELVGVLFVGKAFILLYSGRLRILGVLVEFSQLVARRHAGYAAHILDHGSAGIGLGS